MIADKTIRAGFEPVRARSLWVITSIDPQNRG
jgi:hypothetical protein